MSSEELETRALKYEFSVDIPCENEPFQSLFKEIPELSGEDGFTVAQRFPHRKRARARGQIAEFR